MTLRIADATAEDIFAVAQNMRGDDYEEFSALSHAEDRSALAHSLVERLANRKDIMVGSLGEPICIGGVIEARPNVITLLFMATDRFPEIGLGITRWIKKELFPRLAAAGVHRIETISMAGHLEAHAWLRVLGLKEETGPLAGYGKGGEAFIMFAWSKPCS